MTSIIKQKSRAWKWRKASQRKAKLCTLRKIGVNCGQIYQKCLQYDKKTNAKNQKRIQGYCKIQMTGSHQPQGSHYRSCSSPRYSFNNNTRNDRTKLSAETSFMEKRTVQRRKESIYEIGFITGFWAAQPSPKKTLWAEL